MSIARVLLLLLLFGGISCSNRFQEMSLLLQESDNVLIPYDTTYEEFAVAMAHFAELDKLLPAQPERIVFTGSSSIRLWGKLRQDLDALPYLVINRGFGGSTLSEIVYYYDELIAPHNPAAVVLYCGENDIIEGKSPEQIYAAFKTFVRVLVRRNPDTKLLYIGMKPSPIRHKRQPYFDQINSDISRFITRLDSPNIRFLDIKPHMMDSTGTQVDASLYMQDSLHLNRNAYIRWKDAVLDALTPLLEGC